MDEILNLDRHQSNLSFLVYSLGQAASSQVVFEVSVSADVNVTVALFLSEMLMLPLLPSTLTEVLCVL